MVVRWLDEPPVRFLGVPPQTCLENTLFATCYAAQTAQAIDACKDVPLEKRGECTLYYNDFYAYQHCRNLCPQMTAPIQPAEFPPGSSGNRTAPDSYSLRSPSSAS